MTEAGKTVQPFALREKLFPTPSVDDREHADPNSATAIGTRGGDKWATSEEGPVETTINGDGGAGDVVAARGDEKRDERRHVLGISIPAETLRRFWVMVSHYHGQTLNLSELGRSFGVSDHTVRRYLEILSGTFMIRLLPPWHADVGKRLVKAPKLYIRDSGLFHTLHTIATSLQLESHPKLGASWEGFPMEQAVRLMDVPHPYFWRTHTGAELDLVWQAHGALWGRIRPREHAPRCL